MRINTNVSALTANEANHHVNLKLQNSLEKLSSGLKINKASDDASGLAIADKLRTQASSVSQAIDNGNSAVTLVQIADKAMAEISNILDTVKQKLIQAKTSTTSDEGKKAIAKDVSKLLEQINNIAEQTNYNKAYLLQADNTDNGPTKALSFQMGELRDNTIDISADLQIQANTEGLEVEDLRQIALNDGIITVETAGEQMAIVDKALDAMNAWRADYGSTQNQVESAVRNLMTQHTNLKAAESVIRDVDYADESANFSQSNIISQAGTFALSQANKISQNVLRLLQ